MYWYPCQHLYWDPYCVQKQELQYNVLSLSDIGRLLKGLKGNIKRCEPESLFGIKKGILHDVLKKLKELLKHWCEWVKQNQSISGKAYLSAFKN